MRSLVQTGLVFSLVLAAVAAGCSSSSSDDSSSAGASNGGSGGSSKGGSSNGGSSNAGTSSEAGDSAGGAPSGGAGSAEAGAANGGETASAGAAGASDTAAAGAGGAAEPPLCNSLVVSGPSISVTHSASAAPTLAQGQLVAGTYQLTTETVYDGGTGTGTAQSIATVAVSGTSATINTVDATGVHSTAVIALGSPATAAPDSVKITCSNGPFASAVGSELKAVVSYNATATSFSLYASPLQTLTVFTLKP